MAIFTPLIFAVIIIVAVCFLFKKTKTSSVKNAKVTSNWFDGEKAFANNGERMKQWAKNLYCIYVILFTIAGILTIILGFAEIDDLFFLIPIGVVAILFAPFIAYASTCFLHGFGELVSNSYGNTSGKGTFKNTKTNGKTSLTYDDAKEDKTGEEEETKGAIKTFLCPKCENPVNLGDPNCQNCGASFDWNKI